MARNNCKSGTNLESTGIASGVQRAAEAKQPTDTQRTGAAIRYIYMAGALAVAALLIMLAAV